MERRSELDAQAVGEAGSDVTRGDTDVVLDTLGINDALPAADKLAAAGAVAVANFVPSMDTTGVGEGNWDTVGDMELEGANETDAAGVYE